MKLRLRRPLAMLLTVVMLLGLLPTAAFAVEEDGLCPHHLQHDNTCGYVTAVDGQPCQHQHDETCGYTEGTPEVLCDKGCTDTDDDGVIDHVEDCSYRPAVPGSSCTHSHDADCGYVEEVEGAPCQYAITPCPQCAAEPVPPSGSNEPEDGQEPSNGSAAEGEQAPGNGGEVPGNADDGDPAPQINGDAEITSLVLKNFTSFGQSGSKDLDLLVQEGPVQWDLFSPYTLEVGVSVPAGSSENKVTITLPEGM